MLGRRKFTSGMDFCRHCANFVNLCIASVLPLEAHNACLLGGWMAVLRPAGMEAALSKIILTNCQQYSMWNQISEDNYLREQGRHRASWPLSSVTPHASHRNLKYRFPSVACPSASLELLPSPTSSTFLYLCFCMLLSPLPGMPSLCTWWLLTWPPITGLLLLYGQSGCRGPQALEPACLDFYVGAVTYYLWPWYIAQVT